MVNHAAPIHILIADEQPIFRHGMRTLLDAVPEWKRSASPQQARSRSPWQPHQLTPRAGEITQLVLQGLSTAEISEKLCITLNTAQGYLKSIFDKVGVRSRRELVAQLFHQHYLGSRSSHSSHS